MNGKKRWLIPDGYMGTAVSGDFVCHEAVCVLNLSDKDANRPPMTGFHATCAKERTHHIRLDKIKNDRGESIPRLTPYAVLVESDTDIVVQASRLDVSQPDFSLMTTIAY